MKRLITGFASFMVLFILLPACGGGGGDDGPGPSEAGQWDQFEWDQGKWG